MLPILSKLFGGNNPIKTIADVADRFITTKGEKLQFERDLKEILIKAEQSAEEERTKRHENDMRSDSWLSKNIRPMSLIFLLIVLTTFALTDGNVGEFVIKEHYISIYEQLALAAFSFYFIIRGINKFIKN